MGIIVRMRSTISSGQCDIHGQLFRSCLVGPRSHQRGKADNAETGYNALFSAKNWPDDHKEFEHFVRSMIMFIGLKILTKISYFLANDCGDSGGILGLKILKYQVLGNGISLFSSKVSVFLYDMLIYPPILHVWFEIS